jgi:hypothetical protein
MLANLTKWLCVYSVAFICLFVTGSNVRDAGPTPEELVNRYKKAVTCWDTSVAMRVEVVHDWAYKSPEQTDIRRWVYDAEHRREGDRCEWFGRCQFDGELDGEKYSHTEQFRQVVGGDFVSYYSKRDSEEEPPEAVMLSTVEESLFVLQAQGPDGGFLQGHIGGIGTAPKIADVMSECGNLRLVGRETLDGTSCFVVEAKAKYGTFTAWIAPEKGYNALKYTVCKSAGDILRDDIRVEDKGITEYMVVVDAVEVKQIDGVFVPVSGRQTGKCTAGEKWEDTDHVTATRSEVVLNPDFESLGAFEISFPEGTEVTHRDIPGRSFRWTQGKFVPDMKAYLPRSLIGKPLPSFGGLVQGFDPASTAGKRVLVCFWDMNQRPSRNCMIRLRNNAEDLRKKGIVIVAIQSAKVDQDELDEWTRENSIPFAVGMTQGDEERTQIRWGVRSLPWLILTDREHAVRAEGFAVDRLDAKIAEAVLPAGDPPDAHTVTGRVTDPEGQVLPGVQVTEFHTDKTYTTGTDGTFVSAYGPSDERRLFSAVDKERQMVGVGRLAPGQRRVEVKLSPARIVSGRVVDPNGDPVVGAQVAPLPMTNLYVLTDRQGRFDVGWQVEWAGDLDEFFLMARHRGRNLAALKSISGTTETVEVKLAGALALNGTVEEPDGMPIRGAEVRLSLRRGWTCGTPVKRVVTDAAGRYEFPALPQNQEYVNIAQAPGFWENAITSGGHQRRRGSCRGRRDCPQAAQ